VEFWRAEVYLQVEPTPPSSGVGALAAGDPKRTEAHVPYHHLALATRDMKATDVFYGQAMGFELVKVVVGDTPEGGWAKHFFYDTGQGQLMAFWELHDESLPQDFPTSLSGAAGLPAWVNHIAFGAADLDDIAVRRQRWLDHGYDVMEIDHGWCTSIYTTDPSGTLVEFCTSTREFTAAEKQQAREALERDDFEKESPVSTKIFQSEKTPAHRAA